MARGIAHREWAIHRDDYQDDVSFREAVQGELAMCENIGERLGVGIVAVPIRTRAGSAGVWFTVAWVFKTASVPAAREDEAEDPPQMFTGNESEFDEIAEAFEQPERPVEAEA